MRRSEIAFPSEGLRCAGTLYPPEAARSGARVPGRQPYGCSPEEFSVRVRIRRTAATTRSGRSS